MRWYMLNGKLRAYSQIKISNDDVAEHVSGPAFQLGGQFSNFEGSWITRSWTYWWTYILQSRCCQSILLHLVHSPLKLTAAEWSLMLQGYCVKVWPYIDNFLCVGIPSFDSALPASAYFTLTNSNIVRTAIEGSHRTYAYSNFIAGDKVFQRLSLRISWRNIMHDPDHSLSRPFDSPGKCGQVWNLCFTLMHWFAWCCSRTSDHIYNATWS